jgi:hypothetical protein
MSKTDKFWDENKDLLMKSGEFTQAECEKVLMCWYGTHLENEDLANEIKELKTSQQWQPIATAPYDTKIFVLYHLGFIGTLVLDSGYDKPKTLTHWLPIPPLP